MADAPSDALTASVQTGHQDRINDAQLDFYGTKLATCSEDHSVRVFDVSTGSHELLAELKVHESTVWQVAWSHPKNGVYLASCSFDGKVVIHKESGRGRYELVHTYLGTGSSISCIAWAPPEFGVSLACGGSDNTLHILSLVKCNWVESTLSVGVCGLLDLSWAPTHHVGSLSGGQMVYRLAAGAGDETLYILKFVDGSWSVEHSLVGHSGWVSSVSWAPVSHANENYIASSTKDEVFLWRQGAADSSWEHITLETELPAIHRVCWNQYGQYLTISGEQTILRNIKDIMFP